VRKLLGILHRAAHKCVELGFAQVKSILNRAAHFAHALQRIGSAQRRHEPIGQRNDLHHGRLVRQRIGIVMMVADRLDDGFGKVPAFGERCADGWVVESKGFGAHIREQFMPAAVLNCEATIGRADRAAHREHSDILNQRCDKRLFGIASLDQRG
jgi:hypothetical protein